MSVECEQVFFSPGQLLTPQQIFLLDNLVDSNECLMVYKKSGFSKEFLTEWLSSDVSQNLSL